MTTELAKRMKAAAIRAKAATEDYVANRMSMSVCLSECEEFNNLSDGPDNIIALVEALEAKEQQRAAANKVVNQQDIELQELRQHIAELESRTVKLPAAWWVKQGGQSLLAYEKQMLLDALAAAGISIAVEGE